MKIYRGQRGKVNLPVLKTLVLDGDEWPVY